MHGSQPRSRRRWAAWLRPTALSLLVALSSPIGLIHSEELPGESGKLLRQIRELVEAQARKLAEHEKALSEQQRMILDQRKALDRNRRELEKLRASLVSKVGGADSRPTPGATPAAPGSARAKHAAVAVTHRGKQPPPPRPRPRPSQKKAADRDAAGGTAGPQRTASAPRRESSAAVPERVGQAQRREAKRTSRPTTTASVREGGVLTPAGTVSVEPSIRYVHSSLNRFTFQGVEILEAFLIGAIEASDADRDTIIGATTIRLGLTDRIAVQAYVPYVYRNDRVTNQIVSETDSETTTTEVSSHGLGDVSVSAQAQLNRGGDGWPVFVAGLRYKTTTGTGPYDLSRDASGVPTELATGSGFPGLQPIISVSLPSDPVVLFANLSYLWNMKGDVDQRIGTSTIGTVDPGDSIGFGAGMAIGFNEKTSLSLAYSHNFINGTDTEINGEIRTSSELTVGSLSFGLNHRISDSVTVSTNLVLGVTDDAPDVQLMLRIPVKFDLF